MGLCLVRSLAWDAGLWSTASTSMTVEEASSFRVFFAFVFFFCFLDSSLGLGFCLVLGVHFLLCV